MHLVAFGGLQTTSPVQELASRKSSELTEAKRPWSPAVIALTQEDRFLCGRHKREGGAYRAFFNEEPLGAEYEICAACLEAGRAGRLAT